MSLLKLVPALAAAALVTACDVRSRNDDGNATVDISANGNTGQGHVSVNAGGLNMSIDLPQGALEHVRADSDSDLVYPGSSIGGINIRGNEQAHGPDQGRVEIHFATSDAPDRVVAWYRDPARGDQIRVASAGRQGNDFVISGTGREDGQFSLRLTPRGDGGTEAQLVLTDRH